MTKQLSTKLAKKKSDLTVAQMTEQLKAAGIEVPDKFSKDEVFKLYTDNLEAVEMAIAIGLAKLKCLIKSFGDHGTSKLCTKCKKNQKDVYTLCSTANKASKKAKKAAKRIRRMGHRTGSALFGTRTGTMANRFAKALVRAGDKGLSMSEARKARWNPKGYRFNESRDRYVKEGIVEIRDGRMFVTKKGFEEANAGKKKAA